MTTRELEILGIVILVLFVTGIIFVAVGYSLGVIQ